MAQVTPKSDFDLNELPPPHEEDGADAAASTPTDAARDPSMQDPRHQPSAREPSSPEDQLVFPDWDLDSPLSPLDDDDYYYDGDEPQTPTLPSVPEPRGFARADDDGERLCTTRLPSHRGERMPPNRETERPSSQETTAPRPPSRRSSETTPTTSHRSRRVPPYYDPRDDAISKRRRCGGYDEDAASSHGGSSRATPRSPRRHEQKGGRFELAVNGNKLGAQRPRGNRRRRPPPHANQNYGHDPRMQREYNRGRDREPPPSGHGAYLGPKGNATPTFCTRQGSPRYKPYSGPHSRHDAHHHRRQSQAQEPPMAAVGYDQHKEGHGREGSYGRRQSLVHERHEEPPKIGGYHQHRHREARAHIMEEGSCGGRRPNVPVAQEHATGPYQQAEAPRSRGHAPVRPYHPYARDNYGASAGKHELRPNCYYQHRRDEVRNVTRGADRSRRPYGEVHQG